MNKFLMQTCRKKYNKICWNKNKFFILCYFILVISILNFEWREKCNYCHMFASCVVKLMECVNYMLLKYCN